MRRKYIALTSTIIFILCVILDNLSKSKMYSPNNYLEQNYKYLLLLIQIILMRVVYATKNTDTKNIATIMNVIISLLYMILFFYSLVMN